jgi:hypothetical protein
MRCKVFAAPTFDRRDGLGLAEDPLPPILHAGIHARTRPGRLRAASLGAFGKKSPMPV